MLAAALMHATWNALLKSLEEPPDFVIFMFASTLAHRAASLRIGRMPASVVGIPRAV